MLIPFAELLERVGPASALGAFTCYDATTATGIARAAEETGQPAVLLVPESSVDTPAGRHLIPAVLAVACSSAAALCVQFDHARDRALVAKALEAGVSAVLADGSAWPYEDNIAYVRHIRSLADRFGAAVEAELGLLPGDEDRSGSEAVGGRTDPEAVEDFVRRSGCELLAVSIGNRHGASRNRPELDWERLSAIRARSSVPLSLHGGSGISDDDLARLISLGIRKINVNTEIRVAQVRCLQSHLSVILSGEQTLVLQTVLAEAAYGTARSKLDRFQRRNAHAANQTS